MNDHKVNDHKVSDRKLLTTAGIHPWTVNRDILIDDPKNDPMSIESENNEKGNTETENTEKRSETENTEPKSSIEGSVTNWGLCRCDACGSYTTVCITEDCSNCQEVFDLCADCYSLYYSFCPTGYGCSKNPQSLNNY